MRLKHSVTFAILLLLAQMPFAAELVELNGADAQANDEPSPADDPLGLFPELTPSMERECLLEPSLTSKIGSPVRGVLAAIHVSRGDLIKKGQPLAQLDARAERAAVDSAKARLEYARRRVARNEELYRDDLISIQERDEIETEQQLASLELKERETLLEIRTIRSPLTGLVVDRISAPGEFVEDTEILEVAQLHPLNVEVVLPLELFGRIQRGMEAQVTLLGPVEGTHTAKVVVVDRVVDAASSTFRARLQIPNQNYAIPSGLRCQVQFPFDG
jgi:membrane fusion protein (multidrug efflux system)